MSKEQTRNEQETNNKVQTTKTPEAKQQGIKGTMSEEHGTMNETRKNKKQDTKSTRINEGQPIAHSPPEVKETLNHMLRGKNGVGERDHMPEHHDLRHDHK